MKTKPIFLAAAIVFNSLLYAQIPTAGLIGRWEFSGNANDLSSSGNDGTVFGATLVSDRCNNANSAYYFNGITDYIKMLAPGPQGNSSRSVAFWAKTNNNGTMALFTYGSGGIAEAFQAQYNYGCAGLGLDIAVQQITKGNSCITDNNWHHIALVYDGSGNQQLNSVDFYVDALLVSSQACGVGNGTQILNTGGQTPIVIGNDSNFPNPIRWFEGSLDDYYLYDRVLTPQEIYQLFTACTIPLTGEIEPCAGSEYTYSVPPITGATFNWTLPVGWTGNSSTNVITVTTGYGLGPQLITVSILTSCGNILPIASQMVYVRRCGKNMSEDETIDMSITGIESRSNKDLNLTIYPNPAHDFVSIKSGSKALSVVSITSVTGQIILDEKFSGETQVNVSNLKSGVYFVTVKMDNGQKKTAKLIKE
ncbi:hypothetical protein CNR22_23975 [Sphingobacteriaceae bacterium]|nr:hypothetical protein CNR22_23975 [Sphingobacteriaceae bacterium]